MRSMWKGSISFGLVNIPVKMYTATQEKALRFNQLHSLCGARIKYEKVCPHCERKIEKDEIVRGYEYDRGQYVTIDDDEWENFTEQTSHTVDIMRFVELNEIDPIYFDKTYYLEPSETGGKAYLLLQEALSVSNKIAVAKITIRSKSSLAVVRVYKGILALETIFYPDEIRDEKQLNTETHAPPVEKELTMAMSLIDSLTEPFKPEHYSDQRRLALLDLIEGKIKGQDTIIIGEQPSHDAPAVDLLAALEASLQAQQNKLSNSSDEVRH